MRTTAKFDVSGALGGLDKVDKLKYSLARSMAAAGGRLLRDEAKIRAPVGQDSKNPGALENAIYVAFRDGESTDTKVKYSVSWNASKAPHGHLIEFGYWQIYVVYPSVQGFRTRAKGDARRGGKGLLRKDGPKWIPPHAFLRPAYETCIPTRLKQVMVERGRTRFDELVASQAAPDPST